MVLMYVWRRSHLKRKTLCAGYLSALRSINTKRYDGFADTQALKVFPMSVARAASPRHTEHVHHQSTAILEACFHTDMDELIHAHPLRETEPDCIVVWLLFKAHGTRKAVRLWQEYFRNEVFMRTGWNAQAMKLVDIEVSTII